MLHAALPCGPKAERRLLGMRPPWTSPLAQPRPRQATRAALLMRLCMCVSGTDRPVALRLLSELLENPRSHAFFHDWLSDRNKQTAAHLLLSLWRVSRGPWLTSFSLSESEDSTMFAWRVASSGMTVRTCRSPMTSLPSPSSHVSIFTTSHYFFSPQEEDALRGMTGPDGLLANPARPLAGLAARTRWLPAEAVAYGNTSPAKKEMLAVS